MLYRILKLIVGLGIRLYYRETKVKNAHFLKHDGPMIIIANHPNTLMDAWLVGNVCQQPIYYMAKGTFFSSPLKRRILQSLNMIPINRKVDGKIKGISNEDSFAACYKILEEGKTLVIFPEGNSFPERQLRELKSGTARIALEAENRNNGKLNLKVVPMGLFYSEAEKFRSSVLVSVEHGLFVTDYLEAYRENTSLAAKKLTEKFRIHLERVLVTTESPEQEKLLEDTLHILWGIERERDVEHEVSFMKRIKDRMEEIQLVQPYLFEEIQQLVTTIQWQSKKLEIHADFIHRRFRSRLYQMQLTLSILFLFLGLPLFLFGIIHNLLQYKLTDFLVQRMTKYVEYYAALGVLIGFVLYPLIYTLFLLGFNHLFEPALWLKIVYFISMPVSGILAHTFARYLRRTGSKWKYIFLIMNQKDALKELQAVQLKLKKLIFD
jgi:1-acyl-sn-glycerol-3-phosphate acyltransferase